MADEIPQPDSQTSPPNSQTGPPDSQTSAPHSQHYQRPGWLTTNVLNRLMAGLTRLGVSVYGSRVLEVKGRTSGQWRQTPVNLLRYEGAEYLVSPRGHSQWVKNLRARSGPVEGGQAGDAVYGSGAF